jgi:hypothetical protein
LAWKPSLEREAGVNEVLGANGECEPVDAALGDRREAGVNEVLGASGECEPVDDALGDRREAEEGRASLKAGGLAGEAERWRS